MFGTPDLRRVPVYRNAIEIGRIVQVMIPAVSDMAMSLAVTNAQPAKQFSEITSLSAKVPTGSDDISDLSRSAKTAFSHLKEQARIQELASVAWKMENIPGGMLDDIYNFTDRLRNDEEQLMSVPEEEVTAGIDSLRRIVVEGIFVNV